MDLWISLIAVYYHFFLILSIKSNMYEMNIIIKAGLNLKTYSLRPKKKVNVTRNLTDLNKNPNFNFFFNFEENNVWLLQKLWVKNA